MASKLFQIEFQDILALVGLLIVFTYLFIRSVPDRGQKPYLKVVRGTMWTILALMVGFGIWVITQRWGRVETAFQQIQFMGPSDIVVAIIDIAVMSYLLYRIIILVKGTRAVQLFKGVLALIVATSVSRWLGLVTINWFLKNVQAMLVVALPVVFQPELRRALEQIGRGKIFPSSQVFTGEDVASAINGIAKAVEILSRNKIGALLVLERETGLNDIIETGIKMEAVVTPELLVNIFIPNTPLHDGASIIRGNRVMAAACFLPLTESPDISPELGGRHRASLGITEQTDALAVVVSEETGGISLANSGKLMKGLDSSTLRELLENLYERRSEGPRFWRRS